MNKNVKFAIIIAAVVIIIGGYFAFDYFASVNRYREEVADITFLNPDASGVADGVYIGECDVDFIYAKVEVRVENEQIVEITVLEHSNGRGQAAEMVVDEIIAQQKIDVDIVAGATNSSQVIKKAVDNALSNAKQIL